MRVNDQVQPAVAPVACPFCASTSVATTTAKVDASTYWRCQACGQMWNEGRLRSTNPYAYQPRWK